MIRQPSTYGDLHEMVAKQKLGNGVVRGLVGEPIFYVFAAFFCLPSAAAVRMYTCTRNGFVVLELRAYYHAIRTDAAATAEVLLTPVAW